MSREITRHSRHPAKQVMVGASLSGNHAAQVGSVAAALRHLAKQVMIGLPPDFKRQEGMAKERAHLTAGDGIGEPLITDFLKSIPGINSYTVRQQSRYCGILRSR